MENKFKVCIPTFKSTSISFGDSFGGRGDFRGDKVPCLESRPGKRNNKKSSVISVKLIIQACYKNIKSLAS